MAPCSYRLTGATIVLHSLLVACLLIGIMPAAAAAQPDGGTGQGGRE